MKRTLKYDKEENTLCVFFNFTKEHERTLLIIFDNDGIAEFENREPKIIEDVDGNLISWKICDELVDMGLLEEDEESYDLFYEITDDGIELIKQIKK